MSNRSGFAAPRDGSDNSPEPFRFYLSGPQKDGDGEIWEAFVRPDVENAQEALAGRAAFRIRFDGRSAKSKGGATIQGAFWHGDRGGAEFLRFEFFRAFTPTLAGSGGMSAIMLGEENDAAFSATVQTNTGEQPWRALVRFENGGELVMLLDRARHRGELQPIEKHRLHVLMAMAQVIRPR